MSITSVCAAIASVGAVCSEIGEAVDPPPPAINSDTLPLLYVRTGPADYERREGEERYIERRTYQVRVAVLAAAHASPSDRETKCRTVLDDVKHTFMKYPQLGLTTGVIRADVVGDSGIITLPDYSGLWDGFEVRLSVSEVRVRTYATGE